MTERHSWLAASAAAMALALGVGLQACGDDDDDGIEPVEPEVFESSLSGASEVPPVVTNATGSATFEVRGATVDYTIDVSGITGVVVSHIHLAEAGVNGPIAVFLFETATPTGAIDGELVSGSFTADDIVETGGSPIISFDALLQRLRNGTTYTNVHTAANPAGEIRGQIDPAD